MGHPTFEGEFMVIAKGLPDLERIVSRIHAKNCKVKDFLKVLKVMIYFFTSFFSHPFPTVLQRVEQRSIQISGCF